MKEDNLYNRELSWLSFNYRVLQEAKDTNVPLYERIKFLAIYSSNLDEFFRVRVASLRSLLNLKQKSQDKLSFNPAGLLKEIHKTVNWQQEEFGSIFRNELLPELRKNNIFLLNNDELTDEQKDFAREYFFDNILKYIQPVLLVKNKIIPFLKNRQLYLAVQLVSKRKNPDSVNKRVRHSYAIVEIPTDKISRFIELPAVNERHYVLFLDDLLRLMLPEIFKGFEVTAACSVKLTRDAELYIDDEFSGDLLNKIKKGLKKRETGAPSRFLYDKEMPKGFLKFLREALILTKEDLVPGGKYHNFSDFFGFPNPGRDDLLDEKLPQLKHHQLEKYDDLFQALKERDFALHYPYHSYDYFIDLLNRAADDSDVTSIKVTQYRVAKDSAIIKALIKAAQNGKDVMAFVELKARFDEELNIQWASEMEKAGVKVYYSFPGLKVHAKIALITRTEDGAEQKYSYMATGNFNEKTAKLYADFGLLTSDERLTAEVEKIFTFLAGKEMISKFKHLLVGQFNLRKGLIKKINNEIKAVKEGKKGHVILKLNSIEDKKMIKKLYEASDAGVRVDLIVRGICCIVPGIPGVSENIHIISILDRFLEHSRFYYFYNNGKDELFASSADWMKRNLSRRIEVAFPVYDPAIKEEVMGIIDLQLNDNMKARIIDRHDKNEYKEPGDNEPLRSQTALYDILKNKGEGV